VTRLRREDGTVAGAEALVLGVLVFVFGTLLVVDGWAVVDARFAADAAAREAVRAVVEAPGGLSADDLRERARVAADRAIEAHGYAPATLTLVPGRITLDRCAPVRLRVELEVRVIATPWRAGGHRTVGSWYEEVVDPLRSGLRGQARCGF
jgi:hypothetical protein